MQSLIRYEAPYKKIITVFFQSEAVELIRRRLVDEPTMTKYRSAAFLSRKATQGEARALEWEADAKARHAAAKEMLRDTTIKHFDTRIPDMTSPEKGKAA